MTSTVASSSKSPSSGSNVVPSSASGGRSSESKVLSLAAIWARNYFVSVTTRDDAEQLRNSGNLTNVTSIEGRSQTTQKLKSNLTLASAQAWSLTENLLSDEIRRHGIDPKIINPWEIAADSHGLFDKALDAYANRLTPRRMSVVVSHDFGKIRRKYTANDPRAIGFVSMQFHYTGQMLFEWLSPTERMLFEPYLKVMDDHLYMPLRAAYEAAANHDYHSPPLQAVRQLLPISTRVAHAVFKQVCRQYPNYQSHNGFLNSPTVKISSIRDIEMFQVYLCLCVLENNIQSIQQELFPLCVMLYPRLRVSWRLVQDMLQAIGWEMHDRLAAEHVAPFLPFLHALTEMFSSDIFAL